MRHGTHHTEETRRKLSEAQKGKHHSEQTRRKISETMKYRTFSEEHRRKMSEASKGKHHSEETRKKISEALRGEYHHNWKGGNEKYFGPNSKYQIKLVHQRDMGICQNCGVKEGERKHDTHHIIPFKYYGLERYEEANRLENLITLCPGCHKKIEAMTEDS